MKLKCIFLCLQLFTFGLLFSQVPGGFNYQAIARDESGNPIKNTSIPVTITIQSDSLGGTIFWEELHSSVETNDYGLINLIIGKGTKQPASTVSNFGDIDWKVLPKYIKFQVFYKSQLLNMGSAGLWSIPYAMVAEDLAGSVGKLEVYGKTTEPDEALFEVKNKDGQTVFAVYNGGVRIFVDEGYDSKGAKGGFSVGGFDQVKEPGQVYFVVNSDSIRAYIDTNEEKTVKGGFSVGGFTQAKANEEYLRVTRDSTRVYINNTETKSKKGGFSVGGFADLKNDDNEYLSVTMDSVKISKSLLIPRLTTEERDNLPFTPGDALIIFNMTESCMQIYKNSVWSNIWCFNCAPDFIFQAADKTICSGENADFSISATGTSLIYQWQESPDNGLSWYNIYDGGSAPVYSGCNYYTLSLSDVPVNHHNFKYRCVVSGSCLPNVVSDVVTLNVGSAPAIITLQPSDQIVSGDCSASFSIVSPGYGVTYQWQISTDGGTIWSNVSEGGTNPFYSGTNASTLSLSAIPWSCNNYKYRCIAGNSCGGNVTSNSATLIITPSSIVTQPSDQQLSTDCDVSFSITIPEGYAASYQWQSSSDGGSTWSNISDGGTGPVYSGVTASTLSLVNVPKAYDNYEYRCVVSSLCGPNETSTPAILSVSTLPMITIQPSDKLVYEGQNIIFDITTSGNEINYKWQESTDEGATWSDVNDGGTNPSYSGANNDTLFLSNVPLTCNNYRYRCAVSHYCRPDEISNAVTLSVETAVPVTDIDGNTYTSVGLGSQLWMAENLRTTKYNNGDLIETTTPATLDITSESEPAYQWPANADEDLVATHGRLYTWYAITDSRSVCPTGWHVPSAAEWDILNYYLMHNGYAFVGGAPQDIGKSMAATWGWADSPNVGSVGNDQASNNSSGFTALPAGFRFHSGSFGYMGGIAIWWTSTIGAGTSSWTRELNNVYASLIDYYQNYRQNGFAVRCVKD